MGLWLLILFMLGLALGWVIGYCQRENDLIASVRENRRATNRTWDDADDGEWLGESDDTPTHPYVSLTEKMNDPLYTVWVTYYLNKSTTLDFEAWKETRNV